MFWTAAVARGATDPKKMRARSTNERGACQRTLGVTVRRREGTTEASSSTRPSCRSTLTLESSFRRLFQLVELGQEFGFGNRVGLGLGHLLRLDLVCLGFGDTVYLRLVVSCLELLRSF